MEHVKSSTQQYHSRSLLKQSEYLCIMNQIMEWKCSSISLKIPTMRIPKSQCYRKVLPVTSSSCSPWHKGLAGSAVTGFPSSDCPQGSPWVPWQLPAHCSLSQPSPGGHSGLSLHQTLPWRAPDLAQELLISSLPQDRQYQILKSLWFRKGKIMWHTDVRRLLTLWIKLLLGKFLDYIEGLFHISAVQLVFLNGVWAPCIIKN